MIVDIPARTWKKLERFLDKLEEEEVKTEWISEDEAAIALNIKKVTLQNYIRLGRIRLEWYRTGVTGKRIYDKAALLGFKNFDELRRRR